MSGDREEVTSRLSRRFDSDDEEGADGDVDDGNEGAAETDARNAGNEVKAKSERDPDTDADSSAGHDNDDGDDDRDVENVKDEWKGTTMYLPGQLKGDVGKTFKQLDLQLDDDLTKFQKTRHFYPLLVEAGKERLESMESDEIMERLEGIDPDLHTFRSDDS